MLVAHRKHRLLERTPLDLSKEGGQFLLGSQKIPSNLNQSRARRAAGRPGKPAIPIAAACSRLRRDRFLRADYTGLDAGFVAQASSQVK